jgi:hypothetical protein
MSQGASTGSTNVADGHITCVIRHIATDRPVAGFFPLLHEEGEPAPSEVPMSTTTDSRNGTATTPTCRTRDEGRRRAHDRRWIEGRRWQWEQRRLPSACELELPAPDRPIAS